MIVKMSKLTIVGLIEEHSAVVKRLMKMGVVQLGEIPMTDEERGRALEMSQFDDAAKQVGEIDENLRKIQAAIKFLTKSAPKTKVKTQKREIEYDSFVDPETYKCVWDKVFKINELHKNLEDKKNELGNLTNEKMSLTVWEKLKLPVELSETSQTEILNGTIPAGANIDEILTTLDELGCVVSSVIDFDAVQSYVSLIIHKNIYEKVNDILRLNGFTRANFGKITGTVAENLERLNIEINDINDEIGKISKSIGENYKHLPMIQELYDYMYNMRERHIVRNRFLNTDKAFIVGGWTPAESAKIVKDDMEKNFTIHVEVTEPETDEETPVLLRNNRLVYPFEMVTELYSLPSSRGVDPNFIMAPFFWFFFGIMLSDAAYGILLSIGCALGVWFLKTQKGTTLDKMLKMLFLCGISTVLWGTAFGGWFGDLPLLLTGRDLGPLWFNPAADPMRLMVWSFIFGAIQIITAMAMNAYLMIREGKWLDAILDVGLWYVVFAGIGMMLIGAPYADGGKYTMIAGLVGLVLTQGRSQKHIIKKFTSGLLSLYDIAGYFSDILSYSRLLALGLATGVVAQVINQVAVLPGGFNSIFSTIIMFIILIGGHIFNMAINILGAYVHSSRLQYVEFFGKFYEGGGIAFAPLKVKVKYLKLK